MSEDFGLSYFKLMLERDKGLPTLMPAKHPCHDCAVVCELYGDLSRALTKMPAEMRKELSEKWFCHNDTSKSCAGNWLIQLGGDQ